MEYPNSGRHIVRSCSQGSGQCYEYSVCLVGLDVRSAGETEQESHIG